MLGGSFHEEAPMKSTQNETTSVPKSEGRSTSAPSAA